jgi:hypothetical protein
MTRFHLLLPWGALLCLLGTGGGARADSVPWSYAWTPTTFGLTATTGDGLLTFTSVSGTADGTSDVVAANLEVLSNADPDSPATFVDAEYSLTLQLTDTLSGESGFVSFAGRINGTLSNGTVDLDNTFDGELTQSLSLGGRTYTVDIGPYTAPGLPDSALGGIGAHVGVLGSGGDPGTPPPPPNLAPEPSSLALALLGLSSASLVWRRGRRGAAGTT